MGNLLLGHVLRRLLLLLGRRRQGAKKDVVRSDGKGRRAGIEEVLLLLNGIKNGEKIRSI